MLDSDITDDLDTGDGVETSTDRADDAWSPTEVIDDAPPCRLYRVASSGVESVATDEDAAVDDESLTQSPL